MKNIIVLGAGPAGMTTAYELKKRFGSDCSVTIIEKTSYVGGLCRTIQADHFCFDIGGHRYLTNNKEIEQWWKLFLPNGTFQNVQRSSHIIYHSKMFSYPICLTLQDMKALGFRTMCNIAFDYTKSRMHPEPVESLEDFYISRFGEKLYRIFFESYTKKVCGQHPSMISPLWGYRRVGGLSITKMLSSQLNHKNTDSDDMRSFTDSFYYPKYGSGTLWDRVSDEFICLGGKILLNETISCFDIDKSTIRSIKCNSGCKLPADYVISSIPIQELLSLIPDVPPNIMTYGCK